MIHKNIYSVISRKAKGTNQYTLTALSLITEKERHVNRNM